MKLTILLILIFFTVKAPSYPVAFIATAPVIAPYEKLWQAVCMVESSGNRYAIGDRHLRNKSYGIAQIRQVRLDDYYKRTGIRYTTKEMFDTTKSKEVFMYYARGSVEAVARRWNGGSLGMSKPSTLKYWHKIQEVYGRI